MQKCQVAFFWQKHLAGVFHTPEMLTAVFYSSSVLQNVSNYSVLEMFSLLIRCMLCFFVINRLQCFHSRENVLKISLILSHHKNMFLTFEMKLLSAFSQHG